MTYKTIYANINRLILIFDVCLFADLEIPCDNISFYSKIKSKIKITFK